MPKLSILVEEQQWYNLNHSWGDKRVHTFPKDISLKMNIITQLDLELSHYDVAVQYIDHYDLRTASLSTIQNNNL